ncbi:MAG: DivIVA domain-containing protein [Proteobacteria bacterium]|nr:DivIVA domain-containing protein [Pseudomonadota bacterium]
MSLTPQDVQSKQFNVRFRGFDIEEVDAFLEKVAEEFLILMTENQQLKTKLSEVQQTIKKYKDQEKTFHNAIISTQRIADELMAKTRLDVDELRQSSRQEVESLLENARAEANELKNQADADIADLKSELNRLEKMKMSIQNEIRSLLNAYLARLDEEVGNNFSSVAAAAVVPPAPAPEADAAEPDFSTSGEEPQESAAENEIIESSFEKEPFAAIVESPEEELTFESAEAEESAGPAGDDSEEELLFDLSDPLDDSQMGTPLELEDDSADNLDELYEKIDLLTETPDFGSPEEAVNLGDRGFSAAGLDISINDDDLTGGDALPDLDGDMLISLNDPLDELEFSVTINEEEPSKE